MLHTTIKEVVGDIPMDSIDLKDLPKADYYALGHIHMEFEKEINGKPTIYGGPTFPNNFKELEELKYGSFYIITIEGFTKITKKEIKIKEVALVEVELESSLKGTEQILESLERRNLQDKIVLLKVYGKLSEGKVSDIKFQEIEDYLKKVKVYSFLKNTSRLELGKKEFEAQIQLGEMEKVDDVLIKKYEKENPSNFNEYIFPLIESLSLEKQEGETSQIFESRLMSEINKVLDLDLQ
jgi:DNA repair exonuclease SbcCD nuclease subunit